MLHETMRHQLGYTKPQKHFNMDSYHNTQGPKYIKSIYMYIFKTV